MTQHETETTPNHPRSKAVPFVLVAAVAGIAAVVLFAGIIPALRRSKALAEETAARGAAMQKVVFVEATAAPATARVSLPARLAAQQETALFAQTGGYLGAMQVDVGDAVKAGQLLVEIATPVLDREIEQSAAAMKVAQAKIELAQAKLDLAHASLERLRRVGDARAVSQQTLDEAAANEKSDAATLAAARADLASVEAAGHRLEAQKSLARIVAPFDGEITARGFDAGALIVADRIDVARPIFRVTNREEIRAFVDVPQSFAASIAAGQSIDLTVRELAGRHFEAKIVRAAPELDRTTRTRLVEARIANADHALLPGMFAEAAVQSVRAAGTTMVPGEAILIRDGKQALAVIDAQDTLHYVVVTLGRDNGAQVEVLGGAASGVPVGARLAVGLSRQPADGAKVAPVARATK